MWGEGEQGREARRVRTPVRVSVNEKENHELTHTHRSGRHVIGSPTARAHNELHVKWPRRAWTGGARRRMMRRRMYRRRNTSRKERRLRRRTTEDQDLKTVLELTRGGGGTAGARIGGGWI